MLRLEGRQGLRLMILKDAIHHYKYIQANFMYIFPNLSTFKNHESTLNILLLSSTR